MNSDYSKYYTESGRVIGRARMTFRAALLLFALAGLLATAACKGSDSASGQNRARAEARKVKTVPVTQIPVGKSVSVTGTLLAFDQAVVSTKIPGRIAAV